MHAAVLVDHDREVVVRAPELLQERGEILRETGIADRGCVHAGDLDPLARGEAGYGAPLRAGDLELDESRWTVHRAGVPVELSPTEFRLLAYLLRHQGRVLTRAQLLESVWGWDYAGQSQIVETYVSYLRRKLDPLGPPLIHTQRGVGYTLRAEEGHRPGGQEK